MIATQINEDFLLLSSLGKKLFFDVAQGLPINDYHNHIKPEDLATNKKFKNLAEAWVLHDPYKHRAMRICGVPENEITGTADDETKFLSWAKTLPKTIGNPLYLWSSMELNSIFDINEPLNHRNANDIWNACNLQLQKPEYGAVDILKRYKVESLCTSDDLLDDLTLHQNATKNQGINVLPSLRGDSMIAFDQPSFKSWFDRLVLRIGDKINNLDDYKSAIVKQLKTFEKAGCRLADHSLDAGFPFCRINEAVAQVSFKKFSEGKVLVASEIIQLKNYVLQFLGKEYAKRNWILQLHIGAQRFTSTRLRKLAGPAGGYSTMGITCDIGGLTSFFDDIEKEGLLPKIILYTLNPADNEAFATITGSYAEDGTAGKIQFGPGWWYNDQYHGIKKHLADVTSYGLLSQFIGMTTDSRSVFSFSRHEYFRRILCEQIAQWVQEGIMPNDEELLAQLVKDISYNNSKKWIFDE